MKCKRCDVFWTRPEEVCWICGEGGHAHALPAFDCGVCYAWQFGLSELERDWSPSPFLEPEI